jgi:hypothetical protein
MEIGSYVFFHPENFEEYVEILKNDYEAHIKQLEVITKHKCEATLNDCESIQRDYYHAEFLRQANDAQTKCMNIYNRIQALEEQKRYNNESSILDSPSSPIGFLSPQSSEDNELYCDEELYAILEDLETPVKNTASRKLCYYSEDNDVKRQRTS